jgi:ELWxxDGT repeat protein
MMNLHAQKISVLKDIQRGKASSYPDYFNVGRKQIVFFAEDSVHGNELWMSEGTRTHTLVRLILIRAAGSSPQKLIYMVVHSIFLPMMV